MSFAPGETLDTTVEEIVGQRAVVRTKKQELTLLCEITKVESENATSRLHGNMSVENTREVPTKKR